MYRLTIIALVFVFMACKQQKKAEVANNPQETQQDSIPLVYAEEKHFKSLRQVTFGGDNAEAYWSFDDEMLVFQSNFTDWGVGCDQIFTMNRTDVFDGVREAFGVRLGFYINFGSIWSHEGPCRVSFDFFDF